MVEVDGDVHLEPENAEKDALRDNWLISQGFTVLRVTNDQIVAELANVLDRIAALADANA